MNETLTAREKIYDHIQNFATCGWHAKCTPDEFEVYCIGKDTIQDTGEALKRIEWRALLQTFTADIS